MRLEDIKTREDLNAYEDQVGSHNLSIEEVEFLQNKIGEFAKQEIEEMEASETFKRMDPKLQAALVMMHHSFANSACYSLGEASDAYRRRKQENIDRGLEEVRRKEAVAYHSAEFRRVLK